MSCVPVPSSDRDLPAGWSRDRSNYVSSRPVRAAPRRGGSMRAGTPLHVAVQWAVDPPPAPSPDGGRTQPSSAPARPGILWRCRMRWYPLAGLVIVGAVRRNAEPRSRATQSDCWAGKARPPTSPVRNPRRSPSPQRETGPRQDTGVRCLGGGVRPHLALDSLSRRPPTSQARSPERSRLRSGLRRARPVGCGPASPVLDRVGMLPPGSPESPGCSSLFFFKPGRQP
jgi:hypothetical protein